MACIYTIDGQQMSEKEFKSYLKKEAGDLIEQKILDPAKVALVDEVVPVKEAVVEVDAKQARIDKHNRLVQMVSEFNNMNGTEKRGLYVKELRRRINQLSGELGYSFGEKGKVITILTETGKRPTMITTQGMKDQAAENYTVITEISDPRELEFVKSLLHTIDVEAGLGIRSDGLQAKTDIGISMNSKSIQAAAKAIIEGRRTKDADLLLRAIRKIYENGNVSYTDRNGNVQHVIPIEEYLGETEAPKIEEVAKEVDANIPDDEATVQNLDKWLSDSGYVTQDGQLDIAKLADDIKSLEDNTYFGGLFDLSKDQITSLKQVIEDANTSRNIDTTNESVRNETPVREEGIKEQQTPLQQGNEQGRANEPIEKGRLEKELDTKIEAKKAELQKMDGEISKYAEKRKAELAKKIKEETQQNLFESGNKDLFNLPADVSRQNLERINTQVNAELDAMKQKRDKIAADIKKLENSRDSVRANDKGQQEINLQLEKRRAAPPKQAVVKRINAMVKSLKRFLPGVDVVTDVAEIDRVLKEMHESGFIEKVGDEYVQAKGFEYKGKVYIDPRLADTTTPIHEYGHIFNRIAKEHFPELHKRGQELMRGSEYEKQVREDYAHQIEWMRKHGSTEKEIEDFVLDEALQQATRTVGENFTDPTLKQRFVNWTKRMWTRVKSLFGIDSFFEHGTAEDFAKMDLNTFIDKYANRMLSGEMLQVRPESTTDSAVPKLQINPASGDLKFEAPHIPQMRDVAALRSKQDMQYAIRDIVDNNEILDAAGNVVGHDIPNIVSDLQDQFGDFAKVVRENPRMFSDKGRNLELFNDPRVIEDIANLLADKTYKTKNPILKINGVDVENPYKEIAKDLLGYDVVEKKRADGTAAIDSNGNPIIQQKHVHPKFLDEFADWHMKNTVQSDGKTFQIRYGEPKVEGVQTKTETTKQHFIDQMAARIRKLGGKLLGEGSGTSLSAKKHWSDFLMGVMNEKTRADKMFNPDTLLHEIFHEDLNRDKKAAAHVMNIGRQKMGELRTAVKAMKDDYVDVKVMEYDAATNQYKEKEIKIPKSVLIRIRAMRDSEIASHGKSRIDYKGIAGSPDSEKDGVAYVGKLPNGETITYKFKLKEPEITRIEAEIDKDPKQRKVFDIVKGIYNDKLRFDSVNNVYKDIKGKNLNMVKDAKGLMDYSTLSVAGDSSVEGELRDMNQLYKDMGIFNEREGAEGFLIAEDVQLAAEKYINKTDNFIQYGRTLKNWTNMLDLLTEKRGSQKGLESLGYAGKKFYEDTLDLIKNMNDYNGTLREKKTPTSKFFDKLRKNGVTTTFAFNGALPLQQAAGYHTNYGLGTISNKALAEAEVKFLIPELGKSYFGTFAGHGSKEVKERVGQRELNKVLEELNAHPEYAPIALRVGGMYNADTEVFENVNFERALGSKTLAKAINIPLEFNSNHGVSATTRVDRSVVATQFLAAKIDVENQMRAEGKDPNIDKQEFIDRVAAKAIKSMEETNVMYSAADRTALQLKHDVWHQTLSMFSGQAQRLLNTSMQAYYQMKDGKISQAKFGRIVTSTLAMNAIYMTLISAAIQKFRKWYSQGDTPTLGKEDIAPAFIDLAGNIAKIRPGLLSSVTRTFISTLDQRKGVDPIFSPIGIQKLQEIFDNIAATIDAFSKEINRRGGGNSHREFMIIMRGLKDFATTILTLTGTLPSVGARVIRGRVLPKPKPKK